LNRLASLMRAKKRAGTAAHALWVSGLAGKNKCLAEFMKTRDIEALEVWAIREQEHNTIVEDTGKYMTEKELKDEPDLTETRVSQIMAWARANKKTKADRYSGETKYLYITEELEKTVQQTRFKMTSRAQVETDEPMQDPDDGVDPQQPPLKKQRKPKQKSPVDTLVADLKRRVTTGKSVCGDLVNIPNSSEHRPQR
jgi:hypothetical protein